VTNANGSLMNMGRFLQQGFQDGTLTDRTVTLQRSLLDGGKTGRIVTAVFQMPEPFQHQRPRPQTAHHTHNTAHSFSFALF
jgi:hypothetical protein